MRTPTKAQIRALKWLSNGKTRSAINGSRPKGVEGVSHHALSKCAYHGWATRHGNEHYTITEAGREALKAATKRPARTKAA